MTQKPFTPDEMIELGSQIEAELTLGRQIKVDAMRIAQMLMWAGRRISEKGPQT